MIETIKYDRYESLARLSPSDMELIIAARNAAERSYSPYSNFAVGAAAMLQNGEVICGTNIESEVYPQGLCAERTLLFHHAACHRANPITTFAITSISSSEECYPCGACRQTLLDTERRQGVPIRIIMAGSNSATIVESASALLPFAFKL